LVGFVALHDVLVLCLFAWFGCADRGMMAFVVPCDVPSGMVELGSHVFESVLWPLLPDFIRKLRAQVDVHAQFEAKLQKLCKKTGTASTRLTPKDRQKLTMKAEEAARCLLLTMVCVVVSLCVYVCVCVCVCVCACV